MVTTEATLPPPGLPGLDPDWPRLVTTPGLDGQGRTWHVLDNQVTDADVTLLAVHGNPTWSYLWRTLLAAAPPGVRVVACDQLGMGYSERTGRRRLAQRVDDLAALTDVLGLDGPVVTVAHDWGGPVSLGWGRRHLDRLAGIVLMNTAVHQPEDAMAPRLIRLARRRAVRRRLCVTTPGFVYGALALARPRLRRPTWNAFVAPYAGAVRRRAVGDFVEDIPLEDDHPSAAALDAIASGLEAMHDVPALLLWGARDPVFSDLYLHDLERRLPHADVHRWATAGHLLPEDIDIADAVFTWLGALADPPAKPTEMRERTPMWGAIETRRAVADTAIVELHDGHERRVSFADLATDVDILGAGLDIAGVRAGDRVGLLIPPGIDLAAALYACWRLGAVVVVADAGLGPRGIGRALRSAAPRHLIGVGRALAAARTLRWPGRRIAAGALSPAMRAAAAPSAHLDELRHLGAGSPIPHVPAPDSVAAVAFTSGATGPAKGVVYRHHQLEAQRDALVDLYGITTADRLVAAFAPFALYGPAMGIASVVPDMDVTSPGTLSAVALADAVDAIDATMVFAAPAALRSAVATAGELLPGQRASLSGVRLLMTAGAPVPKGVLEAAGALFPDATAHTPYGMTEVLPVADIDLAGIAAAGAGRGVCVGRPVPGVDVDIIPIDDDGRAVAPATREPGIVGEVVIRAAHVRDGYDRLWLTEHRAGGLSGWHRSGDVGRLDGDGRLWIEGRMAHVIVTEQGPVTPIGVEQAVNELPEVTRSAAVAVGPSGAQQLVVIVEGSLPARRPRLAGVGLVDAVRRVAAVDVAAVLEVPAIPVDIRHNSKIDRLRLAAWADGVLSGGRLGSP